MALKITVERVDNGALPLRNHIPKAFGLATDDLPISVVVKEDNTAGVTAATLKHFLNIAITGKMSQGVTAAATGDTMVGSIQKCHQQHVDGIV